MDWQQAASLAIVASAALLLLRGLLRRRKPGASQCGTCSFAGASAAHQESVVFRARKGERPQVLLKFK